MKNMTLILQEEEFSAEAVKMYPVWYDKKPPVTKNAWGAVAEKLEFIENEQVTLDVNFSDPIFGFITKHYFTFCSTFSFPS